MSTTSWGDSPAIDIKVVSCEGKEYEKVDTIGFVGSFFSDGGGRL
jgi:hypothetical protein